MSAKVHANRHGNLFYRLYYRGTKGWERTDWKDTPKNRVKAEGRAAEMTDEMKAGTFNYDKWFPNGNKAAPVVEAPAKIELTLREYYDQWIKDKVPDAGPRDAQCRDYRQHFNGGHILERFGDRLLTSIDVKDLKKFRTFLTVELGLSMHYAKNIIGASMRAMFRDAEVEEVIINNIFKKLPPKWWPKLPSLIIDPFDEEERDQILEYYLNHRPYWEYAFVYFRFWTGTRPGEATGLKYRTVNLKTRKAHIVTSRYLNKDGLPKTGPSDRVIDLSLGVTAILKKIYPLHAGPNTFVFTDGEGKPIDQSEFQRKSFAPVLRILKIRPRDFYNTRHTFISVIVTHRPEKLKWLSDQVGTSMDMITKHYGKDLNDQGAAPVDALEKRRDLKRDLLEKVV